MVVFSEMKSNAITKGFQGKMIHEQKKACKSVLRVFTPGDITTFYYASPISWQTDSLKKIFS